MTRITLASIPIAALAAAAALAGCGSSSDSSSTPTGSTPTAAAESSNALRKAGATEGGTVQCTWLKDSRAGCIAALDMTVLDADPDLSVPSPYDWPIAIRMPDDTTTWRFASVAYGVNTALECWVQKECTLQLTPGTFQEFDGGTWYATTLKTVGYQTLWQTGGAPTLTITFAAQ